MNGFKLAAAMALVALGGLAGWSLMRSQARKAELLGELKVDVERLERAMLDERLALASALESCKCECFKALAECLEPRKAPRDCWQALKGKLRARGGALDCLDGEDVEPLDKLMEELGRGGAEHQKSLLEGCARQLEERRSFAARVRDEQGRLYTALGALSGMAVAVLLA